MEDGCGSMVAESFQLQDCDSGVSCRSALRLDRKIVTAVSSHGSYLSPGSNAPGLTGGKCPTASQSLTNALPRPS